jgi:WD40 repeat protein
MTLTYTRDGKFLVTGSRDGTAVVWDPGKGDEVCRLVGLGNGWMVYTREGHFDGNPEGLAALRWRTGMRCVPVDGLGRVFRVPGLLQRLLAGERFGESGGTSLRR